MRKISYINDFQSWKDDFRFSIDIQIRFSETDMFGHVNNISPFIYFEQARIEFFKRFGLFTLDRSETIPVVADLQCDYLQQIYFGETIEVFVKAASVGNSSIDIHYMVLKKEEGTVCLTGRGRLVNVDRKTGKSVPFSESKKNKLLQATY